MTSDRQRQTAMSTDTTNPEQTTNALNRVTDPAFTLTTSATPIRLFLRLIKPLADEAKLVVGPHETAEWADDTEIDGLHCRVVDSANVAMGAFTLPAEGGAFQAWDVDPKNRPCWTLGSNIERLQDMLSFARMSGRGVPDDGDPVHIKYAPDLRRLDTTVTRSSQATQRVTLDTLIDPGSIREEPDVPSLKLKNVGHPESTQALVAATNELKSTADHVSVRADPESDNAFQFYSQGDTRDDWVRFLDGYEIRNSGGEPPDHIRGQSSLFSMQYLRGITRGLHHARMDKVTIRWGDQFPAIFQAINQDYGIRAVYMVAPRIEQDGGD